MCMLLPGVRVWVGITTCTYMYTNVPSDWNNIKTFLPITFDQYMYISHNWFLAPIRPIHMILIPILIDPHVSRRVWRHSSTTCRIDNFYIFCDMRTIANCVYHNSQLCTFSQSAKTKRESTPLNDSTPVWRWPGTRYGYVYAIVSSNWTNSPRELRYSYFVNLRFGKACVRRHRDSSERLKRPHIKKRSWPYYVTPKHQTYRHFMRWWRHGDVKESYRDWDSQANHIDWYAQRFKVKLPKSRSHAIGGACITRIHRPDVDQFSL